MKRTTRFVRRPTRAAELFSACAPAQAFFVFGVCGFVKNLAPRWDATDYLRMKNLTSAALAAFVLTATANFALAQGEEDPFAPETDMGVEEPLATNPSPSGSSDAGSSDAANADGLKMAFSVPLFPGFDLGALAAFTGGSASFQTAKILYGLDADTWLNLSLGLSFGPGGTIDDGMGNTIQGDDIFGLALGVGYRMYKPTEGKIRPYLEPGITLEAADVGSIGDVLGLGVGATMGVDYALLDQLTIGTGVGAKLNTTNAFDAVTFNLFTADINATFWW